MISGGGVIVSPEVVEQFRLLLHQRENKEAKWPSGGLSGCTSLVNSSF